MMASVNQRMDIVRLLVNAGADTKIVNKDGWTALHVSGREGAVVIFSYISNRAL